MAVSEKRAMRELEALLMVAKGHRDERTACHEIGDVARVTLCEQMLQLDYSRIRKYCAEHDLELPHDVPSEGAE